jgi:two-component system, LytTR family, response regulator
MKHRVIIVEDEPLARATLRDLLRDADDFELSGEAGDGLAAVELINREKPDLVFLDVHLPECSGLEVLKRLVHEPVVIFTTAYDEHAIAAFELAATDYLLKPFGRQRFAQALARARDALERKAERLPLNEIREALAAPTLQRLLIRTGGRIVPVALADIVRLEADGDYVAVKTATKSHLVSLPLGKLEARLDPAKFLRVHRSHVVNLEFVEALEPYGNAQLVVRMRDGQKIVASRQASKRLRELAV